MKFSYSKYYGIKAVISRPYIIFNFYFIETYVDNGTQWVKV